MSMAIEFEKNILVYLYQTYFGMKRSYETFLILQAIFLADLTCLIFPRSGAPAEMANCHHYPISRLGLMWSLKTTRLN